VNVADVHKAGLCVQCGTCAAVCPRSAISLQWDSKRGYVLSIEHEWCNDCGVCYEVCPGHAVNFTQLTEEFLDGDSEDPYLGRFLSCCAGYSTQRVIRWSASSGGVITALLLCFLRKRAIDGAIVTRMSPESPLEPLPCLATTEDEILAAMGSKYCPVPANLKLRDALASEGRFAMVGLPCHIHGLRKAQRLIPELREKVVLCISLFCGMTKSPIATRIALNRKGIPIEEVGQISYRGRGWPGSLHVQLQSGQTYSEPYPAYFDRYSAHFWVHRCTLCSDGVGELADISCGDAWLPEYKSDDQGTSIVIVRTTRGGDFLSLAVPKEVTSLPLSASKVMQSQEGMLIFKKRKLRARAALYALAGKKVPIYQQELPSVQVTDYLSSIKFYFKHYVYWLLA